jgi:hypothetical protein
VSHGSSPAHPEKDSDWDANERNETTTERLDRNWGDLLQELRVAQTGVQLLTGFLLTLPFQQSFPSLTHAQHALYLITVGTSITATALLQAPVAIHRALFRRHRREETVLLAHRLAMAGMVALAFALVEVAALIFFVTIGRSAAIVAAVLVAILVVVLWLVIPFSARGKSD